MNMLKPLAASGTENKTAIVTLQWLMAISTSYLVLFANERRADDPWSLFIIMLLLGSILVLHRIPGRLFGVQSFYAILLITDTVLILFGIGLNRAAPWDVLLLFFFCVFIAAIGESLIQIVLGCLLLSVVFVFFVFSKGVDLFSLNPDFLIRVPFMFGISVLYGYLAEQVKKEKKRSERMEETETLKRQLVSALAHDIKNPLAVILGYAETLTSRLAGRLDNEEDLSFLKRIQENVERIVKLVTGFLDASEAESGKVEVARNPVQMNLLIREVGQQQMGNLRQKNLSLNVDLDENLPEILGDADQLDRVLWNLVGNAIKFTPTGGNITITSRIENNHACVSVKDSGLGIPKEELPLLFSEFRRLKGAAKVEGAGLGLFIVKTIVEAHGGSVSADSQEGYGTTFTVWFPIS
jgi:signal transduction histidine kinase